MIMENMQQAQQLLEKANSGASTLHDSTFYVLTSDRNVYKCLDNNGNTASTVEPTGTDVDILSTA